eukprot:363059-Chlamydomonas_euryale.AAC.2
MMCHVAIHSVCCMHASADSQSHSESQGAHHIPLMHVRSAMRQQTCMQGSACACAFACLSRIGIEVTGDMLRCACLDSTKHTFNENWRRQHMRTGGKHKINSSQAPPHSPFTLECMVPPVLASTRNVQQQRGVRPNIQSAVEMADQSSYCSLGCTICWKGVRRH